MVMNLAFLEKTHAAAKRPVKEHMYSKEFPRCRSVIAETRIMRVKERHLSFFQI